jgi:O-antigen/teichoic acid export membrane protein
MTGENGSTHAKGAAELTRGRLLARNTLWSLLGQATPMVAAAVAVPLLLHALGTEAFGVLSISWTLIGYFTLFDLGLGRALTRVVAEGLGGQTTSDLPAIVGTSLLMLFGIGVVAALALAAATPWMVESVFKIPVALARDARATFYLLALSLPAVLLTAGLGGVLAAYQRFRALNLVRIPMSILSFVLPMAVLPFTQSLAVIVGMIVAVRFVSAMAHFAICARTMPAMQRGLQGSARLVAPLLRSAGWIALINLMVPLFASLDRVLVGAWTSIGSVAYYAPPQEVVTKLWILPATLVSVLFPAFATTGQSNPERSRLLYLRGLKQVHLALFPVTLILVAVGGDLLRVWLGAPFEANGRAVMPFMAAGAFFTGLSFIPSALIQAVGRPRQVAWLLLLETPFFIAALWWGVRVAGTTGAAIAWSLRALVDLVVLLILAAPRRPGGRGALRGLVLPSVFTLAAIAGAFAIQGLSFVWRVAVISLVLVPFAIWAVRHGLADERRAITALLQRQA